MNLSPSHDIVQSDAAHELQVLLMSAINTIPNSVDSELIAFAPLAEALPPIRLIDVELFKQLGHTPRYPNNKDLCLNLGDINRRRSLVVLISHCWNYYYYYFINDNSPCEYRTEFTGGDAIVN